VNKLLELSPSNFYPKPKVFSSVINIKPLKKPRFKVNLKTFEKIVKQAFGNRRKMLRQSLKNLGGNKLLEMSNINSSLRAENLSVEDFCFISNIFDKKFKSL
jgi:16S rRNA (adenine1518-N6/adenine1519-N6)-dimethyltransferase